MLRKLKWQIPGEPLAARNNWRQWPVPGRGPAVEKHWSRLHEREKAAAWPSYLCGKAGHPTNCRPWPLQCDDHKPNLGPFALLAGRNSKVVYCCLYCNQACWHVQQRR